MEAVERAEAGGRGPDEFQDHHPPRHPRQLGQPPARVGQVPEPESRGGRVELAVREGQRQRVALDELEFGVIPGYCRCHYHRPCPIHMAGIVPPPNVSSQSCQIGRPGSVYVTTSYNRTPVFDQQRQGAHPRSADAHEVNGPGVTWCK